MRDEYYRKVWDAARKHGWSHKKLIDFLRSNQNKHEVIRLKNLQKEIDNGNGC